MEVVSTDAKHKTISPYDLSSNDNPGAVISQPLFNGSNYEEWAINFRMALSSRKKFGFLDGTIPKPNSDSPKLEDWIANNHLIVGWIKLTIEPKIRSALSTREIAKDLWDLVKKRYSQKSGARLQQLRNQLATCKQNGSTVDDYFGRLTKLWDGIAECMNTKRCTCDGCSCDLNTAHDKERETLQIHDFLAGLDDATHGVIRSQLCAITPLPDLDSIYQTILQNETIRSSVTQEQSVMSFATHTSSKPSTKQTTVTTRDINKTETRDPAQTCTVCGRSGHDAKGCFKVVGYPEWWGERPRNRADYRSNGRGRGSAPRANTTQIGAATTTASRTALTDSDRVGLSGLTDDQWSAVQRLLNQGKPNQQSGKTDGLIWIIDSGASHHMTGSINLLEGIRDINPISVSLPAGNDVFSTKQGTVNLTPDLCLKNVFFIDGFHMNLISLGQLVTDKHLVAQVTDKLIILQDRTMRTLIGAGEREREGLYRFHGLTTMTSLRASVSNDLVLWHNRLGHPSPQVTGMVQGVKGSSNSHNSLLLRNCDVCFRAKQTRQTFPDSLNKANKGFDLIHCDLWGPYRTTSLCGSKYFLTIVDDYSRAIWIYLLPDKSMVANKLREFMAMIE